MKKIKNVKKGFTLAEILITLTVIGIVAALTIPALLANVEEKVYVTQKKALHARLTQAIAQFDKLSGYGSADDDSNSAEAFVLALAKVYKMNSVCGYDKITSCNFPSTVIPMNGSGLESAYDSGATATFNIINGTQGVKLSTLNADFPTSPTDTIKNYVDLPPAAFTTPNGESVLVYYNRKCSSNLGKTGPIQNYVCANFIYDLNGKKAPNQAGKDIGFITVFSNRNATIAGPIPYSDDITASYSTDGTADPTDNATANYNNAVLACQVNDSESRLPNIDELSSTYINKKFLGRDFEGEGRTYWSGTALDADYAWSQAFTAKAESSSGAGDGITSGGRIKDEKGNSHNILCVRK